MGSSTLDILNEAQQNWFKFHNPTVLSTIPSQIGVVNWALGMPSSSHSSNFFAFNLHLKTFIWICYQTNFKDDKWFSDIFHF